MISFKQHLQGNSKQAASGLIAAMKKFGFAKVGKGTSAYVFRHEHYGYVIRVWKNDDAYEEWIKFVVSNQHNPFVPKIKGKPTTVYKNYRFIRLEVLEKLSSSDWSDFNRVTDERYNKIDSELDRIFSFVVRSGYGNDIRKANVMKRNNGQIVIVDPIHSGAGWNDYADLTPEEQMQMMKNIKLSV